MEHGHLHGCYRELSILFYDAMTWSSHEIILLLSPLLHNIANNAIFIKHILVILSAAVERTIILMIGVIKIVYCHTTGSEYYLDVWLSYSIAWCIHNGWLDHLISYIAFWFVHLAINIVYNQSLLFWDRNHFWFMLQMEVESL